MPKTLIQIEASVRITNRDGALDLTTIGSDGHISVNRLYRTLAAMLPWPELLRQDTTISTTANTATYTYPTSPRFIDIKSIEMQDGDNNDNYKMITTSPDYETWSRSERKKNQSIPDHYMRVSTSSANQIEFRPAPKLGSKTVRITGIIEPAPFDAGTLKSFFISNVADDAFEYLIAAYWLERDANPDPAYTQSVLRKSIDLLSTLFDVNEQTNEILQRSIQN